MSQYKVNHQSDFLVVNRADVKFDSSGGDHRVYIKIKDFKSACDMVDQLLAIMQDMVGVRKTK